MFPKTEHSMVCISNFRLLLNYMASDGSRVPETGIWVLEVSGRNPFLKQCLWQVEQGFSSFFLAYLMIFFKVEHAKGTEKLFLKIHQT